ncbi:TetR/AcrR family transcriptional regulator [Variovorax ginsengisoli]|uniref:TetR/AcrR family transcriptional regulator n=1 Tax=Variovorax ginsengisoli TaxID=363844 RepID=A0ABT8S4Z5_9BURK|nr:TetR/AcrR family transcriptional regulator [Variovorax ginsengisoli]MDN8614733.1 TetR/AcrR family transcriptional regulator [Variovorax ginsengisoli]MDO1533903.1 TetR/AcrR family transcriptional regulator [Variovorax ginsengisoli]
MARGRAAGYDDQRDMILEHAALLFANRGYSATSMNQVAEACGFSKALLYHYYRDKYSLLVSIAENHVSRLEDLVSDVERQGLAPAARLRELIRRFVEEYAGAKHAHRVLTEDVKFLEEDDRERVLGTQRTVVAGFARVVAELRPDLEQAALAKPLTMLLFGMINWMFIWMRPDGELDYDAMAPVVADLFLGGLPAVQTPVRVTAIDD